MNLIFFTFHYLTHLQQPFFLHNIHGNKNAIEFCHTTEMTVVANLPPINDSNKIKPSIIKMRLQNYERVVHYTFKCCGHVH